MSRKALILAASLMAGGAMTTLPTAAATPEGDRPAPQMPMRAQIIFNLIDVNTDGFIDQTEIAALQRALFTAVDTDGDAKLSKEEFSKVTAGQRAGRFARSMRHGSRGGEMGPGFHRGQRGGRDGGPGGDRHGQMQPHDLDSGPGLGLGEMTPPAQTGEGQPELNGFPVGPERVFAVLDIDGDGVISLDEFAAGGPRQPASPE